MKQILLAAAGTLALTACTTVGPDYASPTQAAPAQTGFVGTASPAFTGDEPPGRWWSLFQDPVLDGLIEQAHVMSPAIRNPERTALRSCETIVLGFRSNYHTRRIGGDFSRGSPPEA